jgi:hypothetical protein
MPTYTGSTWAEDTAPQGCDRSAVPGAGNAGRQRRPDGYMLAIKR